MHNRLSHAHTLRASAHVVVGVYIAGNIPFDKEHKVSLQYIDIQKLLQKPQSTRDYNMGIALLLLFALPDCKLLFCVLCDVMERYH